MGLSQKLLDFVYRVEHLDVVRANVRLENGNVIRTTLPTANLPTLHPPQVYSNQY